MVEGRYVLGQKQVNLVSICDTPPKGSWDVSQRMKVPIINTFRQEKGQRAASQEIKNTEGHGRREERRCSVTECYRVRIIGRKYQRTLKEIGEEDENENSTVDGEQETV